jgi:hypothetical protein
LQHRVWLCSPIVLMPGIWILYAGCFQQPSCFIIIIIIIIIDLITHLSIYVLGNLHLSQTLGGIGTVRVKKFNLSLRSEGLVLEICILYDTSVLVLLFAPLFKMFLVNPVFSRYIKKCFGVHSFLWDD